MDGVKNTKEEENLLSTIEDFEQYLISCKKQQEETPGDDIGAHRDINSDIERYERVIEALKFQIYYKEKVEEFRYNISVIRTNALLNEDKFKEKRNYTCDEAKAYADGASDALELMKEIKRQ